MVVGIPAPGWRIAATTSSRRTKRYDTPIGITNYKNSRLSGTGDFVLRINCPLIRVQPVSSGPEVRSETITRIILTDVVAAVGYPAKRQWICTDSSGDDQVSHRSGRIGGIS